MIDRDRSISIRIPRRARLTAAPGALLGLLAALGAAIGGCSSSLSTRTAQVTVTTPDGSPVAGAVVRADPIDPHHPLNIGDYFKDEPGTLGFWRTDAQGVASVTLLRDRPTAVSFAAVGYLPDSLVVDPATPSPCRVTLTPILDDSRNLR